MRYYLVSSFSTSPCAVLTEPVCWIQLHILLQGSRRRWSLHFFRIRDAVFR